MSFLPPLHLLDPRLSGKKRFWGFWVLFALGVVLGLGFVLRLDPEVESFPHHLAYVLPMLVFAPLMLAFRFLEPRKRHWREWGIDLLVILLAASRLVTLQTPFSGHLLLLTYAVVSSGHWLLFGLSLLLWIQATWLKLAVWESVSDWAVGMLLGLLSAGLASSQFARLLKLKCSN